MSVVIHPTAIVAPGAVIGEGTTVGPYSVIGPKVILGRDNTVMSHVVLEGHTSIGDGNTIYQFASVGAAPQDLKYKGEASTLQIGNKNIIREYVTLQPGTAGGGMRTIIGSANLFMACVHVGHDSIIGDGNVFANGAAVAGHVIIGSRAVIGGLSGIHQFVKVGDLVMIGAGSMVAKDIPPFCIAQGDRACVVGINTLGLERAKLTPDEIAIIKDLYKEFFIRAGTLREKAKRVWDDSSEGTVAHRFASFIATSERGVATRRNKGASSADE